MSYIQMLIEFNPVWFISIMGTGISSAVLYHFPFEAHWLKVLSAIMFAMCSICLVTSTALFLLKIIFDKKRKDIMNNMGFSVFMGCYAMGFTSWVTALHYLTNENFPIAIYSLWWIGVAMSLFTGWFVFFNILRTAKLQQKDMNSTVLLPIVALTVIASQGGTITPSLPIKLQQSTVVISFLLWANAMGLSFIITTIYVNRLLFHNLPKKEAIFTSFVPIGFLGQGANCIQLLAVAYSNFLNKDGQTVEATIIKTLGLATALFLQSIGYFFTFLAIASVLSYKLEKYHHGFWAMTFPLGTMSLAATQTYKLTLWPTFQYIGAIYGTALVLITSFCIIASAMIMFIPLTTTVNEPDKETV